MKPIRAAQPQPAARTRMKHESVVARTEALRQKVEVVDDLVQRLAEALLELRQGQDALVQACGTVSANSPLAAFAQRLPVTICTALSARGFHFQGDPFAPRDAQGRPDLAALKLAPHFPEPDYFLGLAGRE